MAIGSNPRDAFALLNLGEALEKLGERESETTHLEEALEIFRAALNSVVRDRVPLDWAATQSNLGNALATLGQRKGERRGWRRLLPLTARRYWR